MTLAVDSGQTSDLSLQNSNLDPKYLCENSRWNRSAFTAKLWIHRASFGPICIILIFLKISCYNIHLFLFNWQKEKEKVMVSSWFKKRKKVIADRNGGHHGAGLDSTTAPGEAPQAESAWSLKGEFRQIIPFRKNGSDRIRELESGMI